MFLLVATERVEFTIWTEGLDVVVGVVMLLLVMLLLLSAKALTVLVSPGIIVVSTLSNIRVSNTVTLNVQVLEDGTLGVVYILVLETTVGRSM